jgi:hypothetical protein
VKSGSQITGELYEATVRFDIDDQQRESKECENNRVENLGMKTSNNYALGAVAELGWRSNGIYEELE